MDDVLLFLYGKMTGGCINVNCFGNYARSFLIFKLYSFSYVFFQDISIHITLELNFGFYNNVRHTFYDSIRLILT